MYLVHSQSSKEVIVHETPALLIIDELLVVVVAVAVLVAIVIHCVKGSSTMEVV